MSADDEELMGYVLDAMAAVGIDDFTEDHYTAAANAEIEIQKYVNSKLLALKESLPKWKDMPNNLSADQMDGYRKAMIEVTALIDGVIGGENGLPSNN